MEYADGVFRRRNGTWVNFNSDNTIYRRTNANDRWIDGSHEYGVKIYRRNPSNSGWIQLYPAGVVTVNPPDVVVNNTGMGTKQRAYSSWRTGFARQGAVLASQGGGEQFGLLLCNSNLLEGHGNIVDPGVVRFSGTTGASGNYNRYNTISFRGTRHTSFSGDPFGSHDSSGTFSFSWQSTGANTPIPEGSVNTSSGSARNALMNWMNNVNGYGANICVYNGEQSAANSWSANYLSITYFNLKVRGYTYTARSLRMARPMAAMRLYSMVNSKPPQDDNYMEVVVPDSHIHLDNNQIYEKIVNEELPYRKTSELVSYNDIDYKPVIFNVEDDTVFTSPIMNEFTQLQYLKENMWMNAISVQPQAFKIPSDVKELRLYNIKTEEVYYDMKL